MKRLLLGVLLMGFSTVSQPGCDWGDGVTVGTFTNPTFEEALTTGWTDASLTGGDVARDTTKGQDDSYSAKLWIDTGDLETTRAILRSDSVSVTQGETYRLSFYYNLNANASLGGATLKIYDDTGLVLNETIGTATSWTARTADFTARHTSFYIEISLGGGQGNTEGNLGWVDNFTLAHLPGTDMTDVTQPTTNFSDVSGVSTPLTDVDKPSTAWSDT